MKAQYRSDGWRPDPSTLGKIIDIGGANSFAHGYLDAVVDIRQPQADAKHKFIGNIDFIELWLQINQHCNKNDMWDYAICTHTLEDINNPMLTLKMLPFIAKRGLIIIPSKFRELTRFQPHGIGFMHHRWIWDMLDGKLTAWPKQSFIEGMQWNFSEFHEELIIEWEGTIEAEYINGGMPYGTESLSGEQHMIELYKQLLNKNL